MNFVKTVAAVALGILIALSIAVGAYVEYTRHEAGVVHQAKLKTADDQVRAEAKDSEGNFYQNCVAARTYTQSGGYREVPDSEVQACQKEMSDGLERDLKCYEHLHPGITEQDALDAEKNDARKDKIVGVWNDSAMPVYGSVMSEPAYNKCVAR